MLDRDRYWDCLDQAVQASSGGRTQEARAWLEEALKHNPDGAEARNGLGEILWEGGHYEQSLREFNRAADAQPGFFPAQLNRVELLVEEFQEHDEALDLCDELLARALEPSVEAEVYYLKAKALFYLDDLEGALFLLRRALQTQGEVAVYRGFEGQILFELGDYALARRSLEKAEALEPEVAHTVYHLALVLEHLGDDERAEELFLRAAELQPDLYPKPTRMDLDRFESAAREALETLPAEVRRLVTHCPILIEPLPDAELVKRENLSPQILGLFDGMPVTEPGSSPEGGTLQRMSPDRILLYKRNLEKVASSRDELVEQIQITVKHEIGHYLGLDEDDLDRLGLG